MIDLDAARQLLNFGASIDERRADEQLKGAVAIHNILEQHDVAYLADEVGMGKTYVALGALALFRHFNPEFRVLVIAPRENIQRKWMKEFGNFCRNNVRLADLRVRSARGGPARPTVACGNLHEFIHEVSVDSRRDFFLRLSSFSFGLGSDTEGWKAERDRLREELPWLPGEIFSLKDKAAFKDNFARAMCCGLPVFDLVIVDEGHNLKHGFKEHVAARNRVLAFAMGRDRETDSHLFPGYGRRANRVLFLSATPIEETYEQLWNQLDVFGLGGPFAELKKRDVSDEARKAVAAQFLVRRVTTMSVGGKELTKNQYRREWRKGGVSQHDQPIQVTDPRKRLVVALAQKKVAELLGSEKFNMSFQIGMLASFESFLQTAKVQKTNDEASTFDDPEQNRDLSDEVKEGLDVHDINKLAKRYHAQFGEHLPHPKMDEVVSSLSSSWMTGKKALIFVRRVASVKELKQKLDEQYDRWLIPHIKAALPESLRAAFDGVLTKYADAKAAVDEARQARLMLMGGPKERDENDTGGTDTFFAWFFRGEGPSGVVSGARIANRFTEAGAAYRTFFERNHVAEVLSVQPGEVKAALARETGMSIEAMALEIQRRAARFLSGKSVKHPAYTRFVAAQAAALELLAEAKGETADAARIVFEEVYRAEVKTPQTRQAPRVESNLEEKTFFTELVRPAWTQLRCDLWPEPVAGSANERFREAEVRAQLLSTVARKGHGLIDIYLLTVARLRNLWQRSLEAEEDGEDLQKRRIDDYLARLEEQRTTPLSARAWAGFDELRDIAEHFDLILDVNAPEARSRPIAEISRLFGTMLARQQPIGGMAGQVNRTLVQQFRMPGYPLVLVTTDLLQEGEDLHTFCSAIHHYGISWTPSSMEQRIGRIDRVRSQTDRRLSKLSTEPDGDDLLQVHFPYLPDTVEILQVERVLERMNVFLRLMHEGLLTSGVETKHIDIQQTLARGRRPVEVITKKLQTAFPITPRLLRGEVKTLAVTPGFSESVGRRLDALRHSLEPSVGIDWSQTLIPGQLLGTMKLAGGRIQPFTLFLDSLGGRLLLRCVSPVGIVDIDQLQHEIAQSAMTSRLRLGAVEDRDEKSYNLTVQEDVLLAAPEYDHARAAALLQRVGREADRLEFQYLPGFDQPLEVFEEKLKQEGIGRS